MEYVISGKQYFICLDADGNIYASRVTMRAFKSSNLMKLCNIYDILLDNPAIACKDNWSLETWESALNRLTRYRLARDAEKKAKKEMAPIKTNPGNQSKEKRIKFSKTMRKSVYEASNGKCAICGRTLQIECAEQDDYVTVDHIIPLSKGGKNELSNYQATCKCCNQIKADIIPEVFAYKFKSVMVDRIMEDSDMRRAIVKKIVKVMFRQSMATIKAMIL